MGLKSFNGYLAGSLLVGDPARQRKQKILSHSSFSQEVIFLGNGIEAGFFMIEKLREEKCHECQSYCFRSRDPGDTEYGLAFCKFYKRYFPNQQHGKPAGERSCNNWS